jgi:hypothetical protein
MSDLRLRVISLGAGVQSTTLGLLAARGVIGPMPDCAIFADTGAEPQAVYDHLDWLCGDGVLPFPVYRVQEGAGLAQIIGRKRPTGAWVHMPIPAFIAGKDGRGALLNRSCTQDYKLRPIRRKVRELVGLTGKRSPKHAVVEQWIGISLDEVQRMKDSREPWIQHRFPLIDLRMTRADCLAWIAKHGYPTPPKSSCTFCPFHDAEQWKATKADPDAWAQAVEMDDRIRHLWAGRVPSPIYLHRSLKPLAQALEEETPERDDETLDLFGNECEGMCGV